MEHHRLDQHGSEYVGAWHRHWPDPERGPWVLTFHWADVDGLTECVGVDVRTFRDDGGTRRTLDGAKPRPVTATLFRDLNIAGLVREEREGAVDDLAKADSSSVSRAVADALGFDPEDMRHPEDGRRAWTGRDLANVAEVYTTALDHGRPPRMLVAEMFAVSPSMASKLIRKARDAGLLGETTQGRPGGARKDTR